MTSQMRNRVNSPEIKANIESSNPNLQGKEELNLWL